MSSPIIKDTYNIILNKANDYQIKVTNIIPPIKYCEYVRFITSANNVFFNTNFCQPIYELSENNPTSTLREFVCFPEPTQIYPLASNTITNFTFAVDKKLTSPNDIPDQISITCQFF